MYNNRADGFSPNWILCRFRFFLVDRRASDSKFTMGCPFGDWQIFQDCWLVPCFGFFGWFFSTHRLRAIVLGRAELTLFFGTLKFYTLSLYVYCNVISSKCNVYTIPGKKESVAHKRNAVACTHLYQFSCINAELNSAAAAAQLGSHAHLNHTNTTTDCILAFGTVTGRIRMDPRHWQLR